MKNKSIHLPCPCGNSSDAYAVYDWGGKCYSCNKNFFNEKFEKKDDRKPLTTSYQFLPWRGITRETMEFYNVKTKVEDDVPIGIGFPYGGATAKVRNLQEKKFFWHGNVEDALPLYGMDKFSAGSASAITITEGELDTLSIFQMLGSKYPVVSIRSASSAKTDCGRAREYLNSFDKIYLALDNDGPGKKAARDIARIFSDKVYEVPMSTYKDGNEFLTAGAEKEFVKAWWSAKRILRDGVVSSYAEFEKLLEEVRDKPAIEYPFPTLQEMTFGIRLGECHLFKAPEGVGKTEFIRCIEAHTLRNTDYNIGVIHLEEPKERVIKGLAGHELHLPVHLPNVSISNSDVMSAFRKITKRDDRVHVYTHFGSDDPDVILDIIRFLATTCNCRVIFLDHISMIVSGNQESDERQTLDYISTQLAMMAVELDFALAFISHVNDDGLTRGSRNISKVAHTVVSLKRNITALSEEERNITYLMVEKNRFGSVTGPAGRLKFDRETFNMSEIEDLDLAPI